MNLIATSDVIASGHTKFHGKISQYKLMAFATSRLELGALPSLPKICQIKMFLNHFEKLTMNCSILNYKVKNSKYMDQHKKMNV